VSRELLISVIDDDALFRTALVEAVSSLGYGARGYASAEDFIAEDTHISCDCVITDVHMPGMSGIDLKQLLIAQDSKIPVIMITARDEPGLEARAAAAGAVCLLRKPFESAGLIQCLAKALNV
jgi:FixJ family two-component response regulator